MSHPTLTDIVVVIAVLLASALLVVRSCPAPCTCHYKNLINFGENRQHFSESSDIYDDFDSWYRAQYVATCSNGNLTDLPVGVDSDVRLIHLQDNKITQLKSKIFEYVGLTRLRIVYLNNNNITVIEEDAFVGLTELRKLVLDSNNITSLPENVFRPCVSLLYLSLDGNKLVSLSDNVVSSLTNLNVLKLSRNNLQSLPESIYRMNLTYLDISSNQVPNLSLNFSATVLNVSDNSRVSFSDEDDLRSLVELNVSLNILTYEEGKVISAPNLEVLVLNGCNITHEGLKFFLAINSVVRVLQLGDNNLHKVELSTMLHLTDLNLERNYIDSVFLNNTRLTRLNLNENPLNLLEYKTFLNSLSLTTLFLQSCNITEIKENTFSNVPRLKYLLLDYNLLTDVEDGFHHLHDLELLSLEGNKITHIRQDAFLNNVNLHGLILSRNPLLIPAASPFLSAPTLTYINLAFCNISSISTKFFSLTPYLNHIYLGNNSLSSVAVETFQGLLKLAELDLSGNPLVCDGRLKKVFHLLLTRNVHSSAQCVSPRGDWRFLEHMYFDEEHAISESPLNVSEHFSHQPQPLKLGLSSGVKFVILAAGLVVGVLVGLFLDVAFFRRCGYISFRRGSNWRKMPSEDN